MMRERSLGTLAFDEVARRSHSITSRQLKRPACIQVRVVGWER
jgi:hypothetical protein